jgi:hypothetical protein
MRIEIYRLRLPENVNLKSLNLPHINPLSAWVLSPLMHKTHIDE